jgi:conjugative relaxase-like TrwC/TraI family protein
MRPLCVSPGLHTFDAVQTTHKIAGSDADAFATYLTCGSRRGDYYLDGEDSDGDGAAGMWHGSPAALRSLGLSVDSPVARRELLALMDGRAPNDGREIRAAGGNKTRVAGIDLTFSAPKSVSALWAACSGERRGQIERAHREAVESAIEHVEQSVELVRTREAGTLKWGRARSLAAAQFMHTSSRLTRSEDQGGVPDPQLHTHVVVLAAERADGRFAAVDSRELFRSARVNGAWYRAVLADNLKALGLRIEKGTGKDGRYFELEGVPKGLTRRWSARSAEIDRAAREFRGRYGRDPRAGELGSLTVATRGTKTQLEPVSVDGVWKAVAGEYDLTRENAHGLFGVREHEQDREVQPAEMADELLGRVTRNRSTVPEREMYATAYELSAGVCHPAKACGLVGELEGSGELVGLQDGSWTTRELRERERQTVEIAKARSVERVAPVSDAARERAQREVAEEIGGPLSAEQREAVEKLTGHGAHW